MKSKPFAVTFVLNFSISAGVQESALPITGMMFTYIAVIIISMISQDLKGWNPVIQRAPGSSKRCCLLSNYHLVMYPPHEVDVKGLQPMPCWCNEVKAGMDQGIRDLRMKMVMLLKMMMVMMMMITSTLCTLVSPSK